MTQPMLNNMFGKCWKCKIVTFLSLFFPTSLAFSVAYCDWLKFNAINTARINAHSMVAMLLSWTGRYAVVITAVVVDVTAAAAVVTTTTETTGLTTAHSYTEVQHQI